MVKNIIKLYKRFFIHKTNKKCKKHRHVLYIHGYDITYAGFKTLQLYNFDKSDQNATKLCTRLFLHNIKKNLPQK